jgi:hypothetical protein
LEGVIGTDPEFVMVSRRTRRIIAPHGVIHDPDPHNNRGQAAAIGVDGNRATSSIELRPGISDSGEELVNRMSDLMRSLRNHYHPPSVAYVAGAWVEPEPLGGHIHLGFPAVEWGDPRYGETVWRVYETIQGWKEMTEALNRNLFDDASLRARVRWARDQGRDFADSMSIRPHRLEEALVDGHVEYRYPPSWMMTPEAAYCYLGGAEVIMKHAFNMQHGVKVDWEEFVSRMFKDDGLRPESGLSLADAYKVAIKYTDTQQDIMDHWTE